MRKSTAIGVLVAAALLGVLYVSISSRVPAHQESPAFAIALESAVDRLETSRVRTGDAVQGQELTFDPSVPTCDAQYPTCIPDEPTCVTLRPDSVTCYVEDPNCCTYEVAKFTCDPQEPTCEWGQQHCVTGRYGHPTCSADPKECPDMTYLEQYTCTPGTNTCDAANPRCERSPTAAEKTTWGAIKHEYSQ